MVDLMNTSVVENWGRNLFFVNFCLGEHWLKVLIRVIILSEKETSSLIAFAGSLINDSNIFKYGFTQLGLRLNSHG